MIKALLLDADGVVIQGRKRYFSDILAEEKGIEVSEILKFFKNDYKKCVLGQADLKDEISKYFPAWKWDQSVDELLEYWFSHDGKPSEEVLQIVKQMRERGIKVYIASDHTKYRAEDIMIRMGMEEFFDGSFFSYELGYTKKDIEFYQNMIKKLGLKADEIMFWDDEQENVEAAEKAGVAAKFYESFDLFKNEIEKIFLFN